MDDKSRYIYWNHGNTHPESWEVTARELAHSAQVLYLRSERATKEFFRENPQSGSPAANQLLADMSIRQVAFMLAGFAIENVLKGIRVQQYNGEKQVSDGDPRIKSLTGTHNLSKLATDAGLTVSSEEKKLLVKLTDRILWSGRYPRPKRPEDFLKEDPDTGCPEIATSSPSDWPCFVALFNALIQRIPPPKRGAKSDA